MVNSVPSLIALSTDTVALCACKIQLEIDNPSPVPTPVGLVVKNGEKIFC